MSNVIAFPRIGAPPARTLVTATVAARHLGVTVSALRAWTRDRVVPHYKLAGRRVRYDLAQLDAWLEAGAVPTRAGGDS